MKQILLLPSFLRCVKKFSKTEKEGLARSLDQLNHFVLTGEAPYGFRYKKINHDKYEFRIGLKLRVLVKEEANNLYLVFIGNHDDIERYMRRFRNI